jgi:hypothetical protein
MSGTFSIQSNALDQKRFNNKSYMDGMEQATAKTSSIFKAFRLSQ